MVAALLKISPATRLAICGGVVSTLLEVTLIAAEVVVLPEVSRATAVTVCVPLISDVVFHDTEYGEDVSSAPRLFPSTLNWTPATATLSDAVAVAVTVPVTVAPAAGAVTDTVGGAVSATPPTGVFMS